MFSKVRFNLPQKHIDNFVLLVKKHNYMWTEAMKYMPDTKPTKESLKKVEDDLKQAIKNKQINKFFKFK